MDTVFVLYEQITALDIVGPYEILASHPDVKVQFAAHSAGHVRCDKGLSLIADSAFGDISGPDLIVVPGSSRWRSALNDQALLEWLATASQAAALTTSVCTGSTLLAKAGLLAGRKATTHWVARETLAALGATVINDRVVTDGDVITCAGVSAGIDMGLTLAAALWGEAAARAIQLGLEYDPQPPFDSGSQEKAAPELVSAVRAALDRT
jgi:transcriptional regulator GlxA family with amidase domain